MFFGIQQNQGLEQKQILAGKLIQSAEILQMDVQELSAYVEEQALENPLIDLDEMEKGRYDNTESETENPQKEELFSRLEWLGRTDEQNRVYYSEEYADAKAHEAWNVASEENSLQDYLMSQLVMCAKTKTDYDCLSFLVYSLDERGYLSDDLSDIQEKLEISEEALSRYLSLLQSAEPAGIGARNLQECLLLQLARMEEGALPEDAELGLLRRMVEDHLDALAKRHFKKVAEALSVSTEMLLLQYTILQKLNPIPGNSFSQREKLRYIKPDVTVVKFENYFEVLITDVNVPKLSVNPYYEKLMREAQEGELYEYLQNKYRQVEWLRHCMEERNATLKRVAMEIVNIQREFFEKPDGRRVPMSLADVAQRLGVHESTISRTVKHKFLQCTRGVFPLNYFLVKKVGQQADGEALFEEKTETGAASQKENSVFTPEDIKQRIRSLIDGENPGKPYSDQKLSELLLAEHIQISRRTVAKYRAELLIPDTTGRRST